MPGAPFGVSQEAGYTLVALFFPVLGLPQFYTGADVSVQLN